MKKTKILLLGFLSILAIYGCNNRRFSKFFTMSTTSYKPYDNKFFFDELKELDTDFIENENTLINYGSTGWKEETRDTNDVFILMTPRFHPGDEEVKALKEFASRGNNVILLSYSINETLRDSLFYQVDNSNNFHNYFMPDLERGDYRFLWKGAADSSLNDREHWFPGHTPLSAPLDSVYELSNNAVTEIEPLLISDEGMPRMLKMTCGKGKIYYSNSPIMFTNYFLLYKKNYRFLNEFISETGLDTRRIIWDNYYRKQKSRESRPSTLSRVLGIIHQYPPLTWAFYTLLSGLALFILIYYRRTLRQVAIIPPLKNSALGFTNVLSNLYWNRQDHAAIAHKIVQHLHEYLHTKFQIYNKDFTLDNIEKLAAKTNVDKLLIKDLLRQIEQMNNGIEIDKYFLNSLYTNTQRFYKISGGKN
jgi:hypothetical protein